MLYTSLEVKLVETSRVINFITSSPSALYTSLEVKLVETVAEKSSAIKRGFFSPFFVKFIAISSQPDRNVKGQNDLTALLV